MKIYEIVLIAVAAVYAILLLIFLKKVNKPIKFLLIQAAVSLSAIAVINLTSFASGVHIPVNYGTVFGTLSAGLPFLGGILIINRIFML